jgi:hypothetical protein
LSDSCDTAYAKKQLRYLSSVSTRAKNERLLTSETERPHICRKCRRNGLRRRIRFRRLVRGRRAPVLDPSDASHARSRANTNAHKRTQARARTHTHTHTTRRQDSYSRCGHALDCGVVDGHANPSQVFVHRGEIVHIQKHLEIAIAMAEQRPLHRSQDAPFLAAGSWRSRST